jgi:hypothetical protein
LVKKLTVIGIIGNTHGVNNAAKPEKKAMIKIVNKLLSDDFGCLLLITVLFFSVTVVLFLATFEFTPFNFPLN